MLETEGEAKMPGTALIGIVAALLAEYPLESLRAEVAQLERELGPVGNLGAEVDSIDRRLGVLGALQTARGDGLAHVLEDVARASPAGVSLQGLTWNRAGGDRPADLTLTLRSGTRAQADALAANLAAGGRCAAPAVRASGPAISISCVPADGQPADLRVKGGMPQPKSERELVETRLVGLT